MSRSITRRRFLKSTAAAGIATATGPALLTAADAPKPATTQYTGPRLNIGIIGTGGRGFDHVREIHAIPAANVVALCDVDSNIRANAAKTVASAKHFIDFREMLPMKNLDAVVVATPDHSHAVITAAALRAGKHVYCEKPLCHTVAETRAITALAKETGLVTQLGIQIHALDNYRRVVELIQAGAIGPVHEVHIWNNRTHKPYDKTETAPPPNLNYDLWLGPASQRPFRKGYHPYSWREWWSFGSALLGDIGCHLMDVAFWALDLRHPVAVAAEGGPPSDEICAEWIVATYEFPQRGERPPVKMTWYDPPKVPPQLASWKLDPKYAEGVMFVGEAGMLYTNYGEHLLLPQEKFAGYTRPPQRIAKSPGHQREWIDACLKNDPAAVSAPFSYGGLLTETALLGVVACRAGAPLKWDAANMKFPNHPDAERYLRYDYRPGWQI